MRENHAMPRRVWAAALALLLTVLALSPNAAQAKKKESLVKEPGYYVRWRRGLPPQDGQWHRVLIVDTTGIDSDFHSFLRGNAVERMRKLTAAEQVGVYSGITYSGSSKYTSGYNFTGAERWNVFTYDEGVGGDLVVVGAEGRLSDYPEIDLEQEVFYTADFMNTPALRYNSTGGSAGNGREPHYHNAPYYDLKLCDNSAGDGKLTDLYARCRPDVDKSDAGEELQTFRFVKDYAQSTPLYFVGHEHHDNVDKNKYVIGALHDKDDDGTNVYLKVDRFSVNLVSPDSGDKFHWVAKGAYYAFSSEFYIYYGDKVAIDAVKSGQVIEGDSVESIEGGNILTLARGSTLTVRDGGVLSVGGTFFNDGTIRVEKGGTLLVKKNASITPWDCAAKVGNIICDGGDVIVYSNAKVVCNGDEGLRIKDGTAYNYGAILTRNVEVLGLPNCFHNYGALHAGVSVQSDVAQRFRDETLSVNSAGQISSSYLKNMKSDRRVIGSGCVTGNNVWFGD